MRKEQRVIIDAIGSVLEVYRISDHYIKECAKTKSEVDYHLMDYLDESKYFSVIPDINYDIFEGTKISDFRTLRTDGKWIWSADLNFYTLNYGFRWPNNFINHVKKQGSCVVSDRKVNRLSRKCGASVFYLRTEIEVKNYDAVAFKELKLL